MTDKPDAKTVLEAHEHLVTSLRADPKHGGGMSWTEGVTIIALYDALAASEARVEALEKTMLKAYHAAAGYHCGHGDAMMYAQAEPDIAALAATGEAKPSWPHIDDEPGEPDPDAYKGGT
jgi:hypothetical protein